MSSSPDARSAHLVLAIVRKLGRKAGDVLAEGLLFDAAVGLGAPGGIAIADAINDAIARTWLEATSDGLRLTPEGYAAALAPERG